MLNQIVLVGRLTEKPEIKEGENGSKYAILNIAIPRSYKNSEGVYETDFVAAKCFDMVAENTTEYCDKGDIIGIKGRVETKDCVMYIIAEKVTFLTNN